MEQEINWNEFKNKLIELNGKIETIEEISRHKGDKFNIFKILDREALEVKTHSLFLRELLNPKGSHYQGDLYLRIFLEEILNVRDEDIEKKEDFSKDIFKIDDLLKDVEVDRETPIKNGQIDFTISNDKYYIAIEMKIYSLENGNQLDKYRAFLDKKINLTTELYYLTLFGDEADKSKTKNYKKISFIENISNFIEKSIEKSASLPIIRETLIQYQTTIKNITNQSTKDIQMEVLEMINNPQMARTATELSKSLAYAWAKREVLFWRKLAEKLEEYLRDKKDWTLKQYVFFSRKDSEVIEEVEKNILDKITSKPNETRFSIEKNNFLFNMTSPKSEKFYYSISTTNNKININEIHNILKFEIDRGVKFKYAELSFSKDYSNPTYDVFDDNKLDEIVEYIYEEAVRYMDSIIESKLV